MTDVAVQASVEVGAAQRNVTVEVQAPGTADVVEVGTGDGDIMVARVGEPIEVIRVDVTATAPGVEVVDIYDIGPRGPAGPPGPAGPSGGPDLDLPDLALLFENGLV